MAALVAASPQPIQLFGPRSSHMSKPAPLTPRSPKSVPSSTLPPVETPQAQQPFTSTAHVHDNFKRAKNLEAFNSLLPPAVEFVEGSSTGTLALASVEGKYEPINASPKANGHTEAPAKSKSSQPLSMSIKKNVTDTQEQRTSLYNRPIDTTWPPKFSHGSGLFNLGNTCFLNSALQCLLHTPPLVRILLEHGSPCRMKEFCMNCAMRTVTCDSFQKGRALTPSPITKNLHLIAKHLRKGRQEDSHEFLRYAIDAMQKSCLAGNPPKLDTKIAETTWVHKVFGGRLRSRVTCMQCGHNSDTFDSILDLSIDIYNMNSLKEALRKFTAVDVLKGADKYKCEKCKKPVNAEKRFTMHEAPVILTVHLKRFTPLGRKLTHGIRYEERLDLKPIMSEGQFGPSYSLYGVICHAGGGPNSGHYFAYVKGGDNNWYEMNDDSVDKLREAATGMKNAYMLFYMRDKGQGLEAALSNTSSVGMVNGTSKKRKHSEGGRSDEDMGEKSKSFIGPVVPDNVRSQNGHTNVNGFTPKPKSPDPQAEKLKRRIEAAEKSKKAQMNPKPAPKSLVPYGTEEEEEEEEEQGELVGRPSDISSSTVTQSQRNGSDKVNGKESEADSSPSRPPPTSELPTPSPSPTSPKVPGPVDPAQFYGTTVIHHKLKKRTHEHGRKRKSPETDTSSNSETENDSSRRARAAAIETQQRGTPASSTSNSAARKPKASFMAANPFSRSRTNDSLNSSLEFRPNKLQKKTYGGKRRPLM